MPTLTARTRPACLNRFTDRLSSGVPKRPRPRPAPSLSRPALRSLPCRNAQPSRAISAEGRFLPGEDRHVAVGLLTHSPREQTLAQPLPARTPGLPPCAPESIRSDAAGPDPRCCSSSSSCDPNRMLPITRSSRRLNGYARSGGGARRSMPPSVARSLLFWCGYHLRF